MMNHSPNRYKYHHAYNRIEKATLKHQGTRHNQIYIGYSWQSATKLQRPVFLPSRYTSTTEDLDG